MAKRKRLTPANPAFAAPDLETEPNKGLSAGLASGGLRAPIADVAGEAAATAALAELSDSMATARREGRLVVAMPLSDIRMDHLVRDRTAQDSAALEALITSIRARGQQAPIEVEALEDGGFGLISGWRRCQAIAHLAEAGEGPGTVLALLRQPAERSDAYIAMVEENEVRLGLSYFERARIALKAVEHGVFDTEKAALLSLFQSASRAKRSKIRSFLAVVRALDGHVKFPEAIGERLGLVLAKRLAEDPALANRLRHRLRTPYPATPEGEQTLIQEFLRGPKGPAPDASPLTRTLDNGLNLTLHGSKGKVEISGKTVDDALFERLATWLAQEK